MKIIDQHITVVDKIDGKEILEKINRSARKCYQSEPNGSDENLVRSIIKNGHTSVLEHASITVDIITNRGISHELVRHRIASYSQESTRYVKYKSSSMEFIRPIMLIDKPDSVLKWMEACQYSEQYYNALIDLGEKPQTARDVLNNALKTEIRVTMNLRSWRNFFKLRCAFNAHPQMKELAISLLTAFKSKIPVIFDDIEIDQKFNDEYHISENFNEYVTFAE